MSYINHYPQEDNSLENVGVTPAESECETYENAPVRELNDRVAAKRKGKRASVIITVLALVVLSISTVPEAVAESRVHVEMTDVTATQTTISYSVNVSEGEDLLVIVYNDFIRRELPLSEGTNEGTFSDLKAGMSYTVAVVGNFGMGERKLAKKCVKTQNA